MLIKEATLEDLAAIAHIGGKFFVESGWIKNLTPSKENTYKSLLAMMEDPDYCIVAAYDDEGELGGFVMAGLGNPWSVEKVAVEELFFTNPNGSGYGIAKPMLDFIEDMCKTKGAKLFYSSSTASIDDDGKAARGFNILLRRNGWAEIPHARVFMKEL